MENFIEFRDVCFSYDKDVVNFVLDGVSFSVKVGEKIAIVGSNGSGKSTLSKLINAILIPISGLIKVNGMSTFNKDEVFNIRKSVGLIFQDPDNQIVATIVEEDVAFALENLCFDQKDIKKIVDESLSMVDMLEFKKTSVENLSGGQKSKVAIAGVLAMNPKCIILDESTAMLDPKSRQEVLKIVDVLNKKNKTTILNITHNMKEVAFSDRVIVLKDGKILKQDVPDNVFKDEKLLKDAGLCLPEISEFMMLLNKHGFVKEKVAIGVDECVEVVANLLRGEKVFECD